MSEFKPTKVGSRRPMSAGEKFRAGNLRFEGRSIKEISRILGRDKQTISHLFNPHAKERARERKQRNRNYQKIAYSQTPPGTFEKAPNIPDFVLAERDRRLLLRPRDLTAAFAGDPLPGFSALDRR